MLPRHVILPPAIALTPLTSIDYKFTYNAIMSGDESTEDCLKKNIFYIEIQRDVRSFGLRKIGEKYFE